MKPKINSKTTLEKILEVKNAEKILTKYNVPCLSCPMAKFEIAELKIGDICKIYNIDLKNILKDLNKLL